MAVINFSFLFLLLVLSSITSSRVGASEGGPPQFARQVAGIVSVPASRHNLMVSRHPLLRPVPVPSRSLNPPPPTEHDLPNTINSQFDDIYDHSRGLEDDHPHPPAVLWPPPVQTTPQDDVATDTRSTIVQPTESSDHPSVGVEADPPGPDRGIGVVPYGGSSRVSNDPYHHPDHHDDRTYYSNHHHHAHTHHTHHGHSDPANHALDAHPDHADPDHADHDHADPDHADPDHADPDGHTHLDRVYGPEGDELLFLTIEPVDTDTPMTHVTADEDLGVPPGRERSDKSIGPGGPNLCHYCLCGPNDIKILCEKGNMVNTEQSETLELSSRLLPEGAVSLEVLGFNKLTILPDTFADEASKMQSIIFEDIRELELQEHSLHFSQHSRENMQVRITMTRCRIPLIPANTVTQLDINRHEPRDHNNSSTDNISRDYIGPEMKRFITLDFNSCWVGELETHALYQARIFYFTMTDVTIERMSQKSIDIDVYKEWVVEDSKLPHLPRNAICVHAHNSVVFSGNIFKELDSYAWGIEAVGQVMFKYNKVNKIRANAFLNIIPLKGAQSANIVFLNNTVISVDEDALVTSELYPRHERKVMNNRFSILCQCNISTYFKEMLDIKENDTFDVLMYEAVVLNSMCIPHPGSPHYIYVNQFLDNNCTSIPIILLVITALVVVTLLVSITVAVICATRAKKAREEVSFLEECSSRSFSTINTHAGPKSPDIGKNVFFDSEGNPSWVLAVPEVKTYQETEVHVTYEELHPIQQSARSSYQDPHMLELQRRNLTRQSCPFN